MMSIRAQLESDLAAAMRSKEEPKRTVLRSIKAAIHNVEISQGRSLDDQAVLTVLAKQLKQREESVAAATSRPEVAAREEAEAALVKAYLPAALSEAALTELVDQVITETGARTMTDMGTVMKEVTVKVAGRADSGVVAMLVRKRLS